MRVSFRDCPHSHVVSPLKYLHIFRCSWLYVTPVRILLRHIHDVQALVCPFARLSSRLTAQLCDVKFCHSLQRMIFAGTSAGRTALKKHFLFKRLSTGIWPCREWAAIVSCFSFSTLAHTSPLMQLGGAIPASRYNSSILVGLRHPVIDLQASFKIQFGSICRYKPDVESANAVVLIVPSLQPHLEFDNFFRRLLRVATFKCVLCMCSL